MDLQDPTYKQNETVIPTLNSRSKTRQFGLIVLGCCFLVACQQSRIQHSRDHFLQPTNPQVEISAGPPPGKIGDLLTPSPVDAPMREEVYTITVTEMPVRDLLFALARDANKNIDVYPGIQGRVTLSAIDQPLSKILDRVAKQVGIRYEIQDKIIVVTPDLPYLKIYQVDYLGIERDMVSANKIATNLSTSKGPTLSNPLGGGDSNQSNSTLTTVASSKFWKSITQNVQAILGANTGIVETTQTVPDLMLPAAGSGGGGLGGLAGLIPPLPALTGIGGGGSAAAGGQDAKSHVVGPGLVSVNTEAGVMSIVANAQQHERIQLYLDSVLENVHRQVLIESTVVEVELSDRFQEGVDWNLIFNRSAGVILKSNFAQNIGTMNAGVNPVQGVLDYFTVGHTGGPDGNPATDKGPVNATIKLLETFGNAKILSSPKIMALNNQPAILKVVKNRVFFTLKSSTSTTDTTGTTTSGSVASQPVFDTEIHTVPVGLVMTVTPQISKEGVVSLNVRPTISRISRWVNDPNPALVAGNTQTGLTTSIQNAIPEIEIKEMETMMRVHSGQVAVMGGLMQDSMSNTTAGVPLLSRLPGALGSIFSNQDEGVAKSELVIFLRPVVMTHGRPRDMYADRTKESMPGVTPQAAVQPPSVVQKPSTNGASVSGVSPSVAKSNPAKQATVASNQQKSVHTPAAVSANAMAVGSSYLDFTTPQGLNTIAQQPVTQFPIPAQPPVVPQPVGLPPAPEAALQSPEAQRYYLDLGSYRDLAYIDEILRQVNALGLAVQKESLNVAGQNYTRLRSGPYLGQKEATEALARLNDSTALHASLATD